MLPQVLAALALCCICDAARFDIRDYGAQPGRDSTQAIAKAVAAAAQAGGGNVYVPSGEFITGQVNLTSRVYLELGFGAMLRASDDPKLYPCVRSVTSDTGPVCCQLSEPC